MKLGRWLPPLALVLGGLVLGAGSADASSTTAGMMAPTAAPSVEVASLRVWPVRVAPGGTLHVRGHCDPDTNGFVLSAAFLRDGTHEFAGVGAVRIASDAVGDFSADAQIPADRTPGTYAVGARCGGANLGVSATVVVTSAGVPTAVPAGSGGGAISNSPTREAPASAGSGGVAISTSPTREAPAPAGSGGVAISTSPTREAPASAGSGGVAISTSPTREAPAPAGSGGVAISNNPIRKAPVRVLIVGFALLAIAGGLIVRRRLSRSLTSADRPRGQTDPLRRKL
jgi:hypothetical protein